MRIYDFAVIGSGPSGNIAIRNFKNKENILWIEESDSNVPTAPFSSREIAEKYRNGGQNLIYSNPLISVGQPYAVGGGLSINAGILQRPEKEVYSTWDLSRHKDWSWPKMENEFYNIEQLFKPRLESSGSHRISQLIRQGTEKLNWQSKNIFCADRDSRIQFVQQNKNGLKTTNGSLMIGTKLHSLVRNGKNWQLNCIQNKLQIKFLAKKVFLACGPIQSPAVLMRSKIIPRFSTRLMFHPTIKVVAEYENNLELIEPTFSSVQVKQFSPDVVIGSSVTSRSLILSEHLKNGVRDPEILKKHSNQLLFYCSTSSNPKTNLVQTLSNSDPFCICLSSTKNQKMRKGLEALIEFSFATGAKKVYLGGMILHSMDDALKSIQKSTSSVSAIHLFSSMPLGSINNPINPNGEVDEQEHLFCIDASILPGSPGVNPQELIMAMANKITCSI